MKQSLKNLQSRSIKNPLGRPLKPPKPPPLDHAGDEVASLSASVSTEGLIAARPQLVNELLLKLVAVNSGMDLWNIGDFYRST